MTKGIEEKVKEGLAAALKIEESTNPGLAQGRSHYFPAGWFAGANFMYSLLTPSADVQERAKELELFKRLWYNRNPVHENNADSGEDMFWGTAELVAREYAQHLAGASSVSGMQDKEEYWNEITTELQCDRDSLEKCCEQVLEITTDEKIKELIHDTFFYLCKNMK